MTLQSISIVGPNGESIYLPMQDPSSSYFVKDILGLDPVNANIASTSYGTVDGAQYQSSRLETRNLVITLGYNPDYAVNDVATLRQELYRKMLPKMPVTVVLMTDDGLFLETTGRVESLESPSFTREPEAKISILCFNPDFYSQVTRNVAAYSVANSGTRDTLVYAGSVPTGFKYIVVPSRAVTDMAFYLTNSYNEVYSLTFTGSLIAGDLLEISTVPGEKGMWLTRSNLKKSILYSMGSVSLWPRLTPGNNLVRVYEAGAPVFCSIQYADKYGGL